MGTAAPYGSFPLAKLGIPNYLDGMSSTPIHSDLIAEIDALCAETGMARSKFGAEAMNDPAFVFELAKGRECRRSTVERVRAFIEIQTPRAPSPARGQAAGATSRAPAATKSPA